ncbi:MAG: NAD(P)-dependent oxidoreductase [Myxococcota bacterium]|jgi:phosphoglycerate dehydrogenase-like enzyme
MSRLTVLSHLPLGLLENAQRAHPEVNFVEIPGEGELAAELRGEILLTQTWGAPNSSHVMQRGVRWVHTYGTGVNRYPKETLGEAILTCSRGAGAAMISEWVLAMLLAFEKDLPNRWATAPPERWNIASLGGLRGRSLGLVGLGGIGIAVARHALGFGMRVRAVRRSLAPSPVAGVEIAATLAELVAESDHLVVVAPATAATRHLVGREMLAQVRPGLHLVNVARGSLVDQDALREALDDGRVARASLDVCEPEPLPEGHWLYQHPRVRLSPHISWSGPGAFDDLIAPFVENLGRWKRGEELLHRVDPEAGY